MKSKKKVKYIQRNKSKRRKLKSSNKKGKSRGNNNNKRKRKTKSRKKKMYGGSVALTDYNCDTVLPDGVLVVTIEKINIVENSFKNCNNLTSFTAKNIDSINTNAFSVCSGLKKFIANNIDSINTNAFSGCNKLETFMANEIKSIGDSAFSGCNKLETFMANEIKSIGDSAFKLCQKLKIFFAEKIVSIGNSAFEHCENLVITSGLKEVESIGKYAFNQCENFLKIFINLNSLTTSLGQYAFQSSSLVYVDINVAENKNIDVGKGAFKMCGNLIMVTLIGFRELGQDIFEKCNSLQFIKLKFTKNIKGTIFNFTNLNYAIVTLYIDGDYNNDLLSLFNQDNSQDLPSVTIEKLISSNQPITPGELQTNPNKQSIIVNNFEPIT